MTAESDAAKLKELGLENADEFTRKSVLALFQDQQLDSWKSHASKKDKMDKKRVGIPLCLQLLILSSWPKWRILNKECEFGPKWTFCGFAAQVLLTVFSHTRKLKGKDDSPQKTKITLASTLKKMKKEKWEEKEALHEHKIEAGIKAAGEIKDDVDPTTPLKKAPPPVIAEGSALKEHRLRVMKLREKEMKEKQKEERERERVREKEMKEKEKIREKEMKKEQKLKVKREKFLGKLEKLDKKLQASMRGIFWTWLLFRQISEKLLLKIGQFLE